MKLQMWTRTAIGMLIMGMAMGCGGVEEQPIEDEGAPKSAAFRALGASVKSYLQGVSAATIQAEMKRHCFKLRITDRDGRWRLAGLEAIAPSILPADVSIEATLAFVDRLVDHLQANPYAAGFIEEATQTRFPVLQAKLEREGGTIIPRVVAWAMVLENITKAELLNPKVIEALSDHWIAERKRDGFSMPTDPGSLFGSIKLASVEKPIRDIIGFFRTRELDPKFLRGFLPLNVFEAVTADRLMGYTDNSNAGWPLMRNPPGGAVDPLLGTGPATFSADGNRIEMRMSLPAKWADLYQVWNMAFTTQIQDYPFWLPKLLIPQVADYHDYPEEYLYRRALALYTALNYSYLGYVQDRQDGVPSTEWADKSLTTLWGKFNRKAAEAYSAAVKARAAGRGDQ